MGLKLDWEWNGGHGVATVGGLRLQVQNEYHPVTWWVRTQPWGDHHEVEVIDDDLRAATIAAQEAAEAAAARLLAEDAGARALMGLRWIPVTEGLPNQWDVVQVWALDLHVSSAWLDDQPEWVDRAGLLPARPTHWRPLPDGPEVPT